MVTGKETFQEYFGTWLKEDFWCKIVAKCFFKLYEMYEMKINFEFEKLLRPKTRKRLFWKLHILFGNSFEVLNDSLVRFYLNISFANLFFFETHISGCGKTRCNYWYLWSLFWEYNTSDEPISKGICGLTYAKCKEASLTVNSAGTDTHGVPSNLVEHHTDAIDLVRLDVDGPVEDDFDHWVSANLGREVGVSQSASFGVE